MDYGLKIEEAQAKISEAERELGRLQGAKSTLNIQREQILKACNKLGVGASRDEIAAAIQVTQKELSTLIAKIDKDLKITHDDSSGTNP